MTDEELTAIRERDEKATSGPWYSYRPDEAYRIYKVYSTNDQRLEETLAEVSGLDCDPNSAFIAHARTDVPKLVAEVARLQGIIKQVREWAQNEQGESDRAAHRAMDAATVSVEKSELREARVRSQESSVALHILDGEDK